MAKIYTRQGDSGQTSLYDGTRVSKNDLRMHMVGELDELNSIIGLAVSTCSHIEISFVLTIVQHHLFDLGAEIATPKESPQADQIRCVSDKHVALLEMWIDQTSARLQPLKGFILPGGGITAAYLHTARTICRRAERTYVYIRQQLPANYGSNVMQYLNRLSDLLFVLARESNRIDGRPDVPWQPEKLG